MKKTKELVTIEFRYDDIPKGEWDTKYKDKTVTSGVFDTLEEAIVEGNKVLEILEKQFKLHVFPDNREAKKERFSKNGGCFGYPHRLITNMAYLKTPFQFYAKIAQLKYDDVEETIADVLEARKRYNEYRQSERDND